MRALALILLLTAGCLGTGTSTFEGPCKPTQALLIGSVTGSAMAPEPMPETWFVAWPDGTVWSLVVDEQAVEGTLEQSRVIASGADAHNVCHVLSAHTFYPGGPMAETLGEDVRQAWAYDFTVARSDKGSGDATALELLVRDQLLTLPEDSSRPGCQDGNAVAYTSYLDGERHFVRASCAGTDAFAAFHAEAGTWFDGALA